MNKNRIVRCICLMVVVFGFGSGVAVATPPSLPPNPVLVAFTADKVEEGRKAAAESVAKAIKELPAETEITVLDAGAGKYGDSLRLAVIPVAAWAVGEAYLLYRGSGKGEDFVAHAWTPLFTATKTITVRLDKTAAQAQKLWDASVGKDENWKRRINDWDLVGAVACLELALLAKKADRPDLVKEVFTLAASVGKYATAEQFLADAQDLSAIFGVNLAPPALSPQEVKEVVGVLEQWFAAVEKNDVKAFTALYADAGQADRLVEAGLLENFKFRKANVGAGKLHVTKRPDGSLYINFECPAQNRRGNENYYYGEFDLIAKNGTWLFQNRQDDGVSLAHKTAMKKVLAAWFAAMDAGDTKAAAQLFADPGAVEAALAKMAVETAGQHTDLTHADFEFHLQPDGQIAAEVSRTTITDKAGKQRLGGQDLFFLIQGERCQLAVPNKAKH